MSSTAWQAVIGLEIHVQLATASKIFSGGATAFGAEPNVQACAVDLAMPGTLPVFNAAALDLAIRFGLAVEAAIAPVSVFARKNYFYPDLPKGYQISQYEQPIVSGGVIRARLGEQAFTVQLVRAHLEEDAGKSVHDAFHGASGIDLNRAGTPLLEVVTEPVMHSAVEAVAALKALHTLVRWIGVCDGNLQEGSFRCDANVSVRPGPDAPLGTRCEIKNLNSFRFIEKAIDYEIERQIRVLENGGVIRQETRLFDPARGETRTMRSKEDAHDYRYFPDPDLPPLIVEPARIEAIRATLPALPEAVRAELLALGLNAEQADLIAGERALFEAYTALQTALPGEPKLCANWLCGEWLGALNAAELAIDAAPVSPAALAGLLTRIVDGALSGRMAKQAFEAMWASGESADQVIERLGLKQIRDDGALAGMVDAVLAQYPKQAADYQAGQDKMLQFLVGQVMKASRGQANPAQLNALLKARLGR